MSNKTPRQIAKDILFDYGMNPKGCPTLVDRIEEAIEAARKGAKS